MWHKSYRARREIRKLKAENSDLKLSTPVEPEVSQATCGFCKDCKFWDVENVECTNEVIFIDKNGFGFISDLKTQNYFGCVKYVSKLSG